VPEPNSFDVELAIEKLKIHKSPGIDQIPAKLIKGGGRTTRYEIHKLIVIWNKEELPEEWKESITVPIYKKDDKTDCSNYSGFTFAKYVQNFVQNPAVKVNCICRANYWGPSMWFSKQQVSS